jgi:hypothetical protein
MSRSTEVLHSDELVGLLERDPELLAIADAIANTAARKSSLRGWPLRVALVATVVVAAVLGATAPWSHSDGNGLLSRALAAVGTLPVLHVVIEAPAGGQFINVQTGSTRPLISRTELWYDRGKGLKRTVVSTNGVITSDVLETPAGGVTSNGIVYDCAWIAAHPAEAAAARVDCRSGGPQAATRPVPSVDPAFAAFIDGYPAALASGTAIKVGEGTRDGHHILWLRFAAANGSELVAIDASNYLPVLVRAGGNELRIVSIETVAAGEGHFERPTQHGAAEPSSGEVANSDPVALDTASLTAALPDAVWLGTRLGPLQLIDARQQHLHTSYGDGTTPVTTATGLELTYAAPDASGRLDHSTARVRINEASSPQFAYKWGFVPAMNLAPGIAYVPNAAGSASQLAFARIGQTYLTIQGATPDLAESAEHALTPVP